MEHSGLSAAFAGVPRFDASLREQVMEQLLRKHAAHRIAAGQEFSQTRSPQPSNLIACEAYPFRNSAVYRPAREKNAFFDGPVERQSGAPQQSGGFLQDGLRLRI